MQRHMETEKLTDREEGMRRDGERERERERGGGG